jgi:hypothetical protein
LCATHHSGNFGRINSQGARYLMSVSTPAEAAAAAAAAAASAPPLPLGAQARMRLNGTSAPPPVRSSSSVFGAPPPAAAAPMVLLETDIFDDDDAMVRRTAACMPACMRARTHIPVLTSDAQAFARSVSRRVGGFTVPNPGGPRALAPPRAAPPPAPPPARPPSGAAPAASAAPPRPAAAAPPPRFTDDAAPRAPLAARAPGAPATAAARACGPAAAARPGVPAGAAGAGDKRSFAAAFSAITAGVDASKGSAHEDLALAAEEARTFAALDALAKREGLHDAASKLTKMKVRGWRCSCGVVSESRRPDCVARQHGGAAVSVLKRFFACRACKRRAFTLDSAYPARGCAGCGGTDYDRAPMSSAGGPKLNVHDGVACREALLTRGEEHTFSLKSLR